jgi:hypothetical protein
MEPCERQDRSCQVAGQSWARRLPCVCPSFLRATITKVCWESSWSPRNLWSPTRRPGTGIRVEQSMFKRLGADWRPGKNPQLWVESWGPRLRHRQVMPGRERLAVESAHVPLRHRGAARTRDKECTSWNDGVGLFACGKSCGCDLRSYVLRSTSGRR